MAGLWKNSLRFLRREKPLSIRIPLALLLFAVGLAPVGMYSRIFLASAEQSQVSSRQVDVQNQCLILSSKMTRAGFISDAVKDASFNTEMNVTADLFHGRILIVDRNYRVIKDTFGLVEGKIVVSEEVIRCFEGENSNINNSDKNYFVQTLPIYENTPEKTIQGVLVAAASTEYVNRLTASSEDEFQFFLMIMVFILLVLSTGAAELLIRPFIRLERMLTRAADGNIASDIHEHTYQETKEISETVSRMISKLKEVDQSRQEFVSNVSHELKTPITSIRVLADSLMSMEGASVELYQEFMRDISDEIDRESKIIDDLLALVKMDKSGEAQMKVSSISINQLMEMILKRLRPIAGMRNVELIYESIREVSADVDEVKLSLAFNNLVGNAIKYNVDDGWVKVTLDADHKAFYVTVADSGIGIPEEFQRYIFERFYRVDKARSRETGGTGLGLAITKSVILMHNGTIKVESREGEGTVFTVRIPLNYVPSGAGKNNGGNAGAVKGSPALKSFWIGHPRRKKEPGKETGNPVEKAKEKGVQDGKR
ncbi:MAG: HAMP domain-containing histidine kinase [Lachnospiraceae bacterium]|nr:HAMP domain-containing histidine kinase [Lachnospiraceae bacterium]